MNIILKPRLRLPSLSLTALTIAALLVISAPASAHRSPADCAGSGLQITLFSDNTQAYAGDKITYSLDVYNGPSGGPIVCDASNIQASIVTPDGTTYPITLVRTALSDGEIDHYPNVVTYRVRPQDAKANGILAARANDTGDIHQNDTNSQGGANQEVNVTYLGISVQASPTPTPSPAPSATFAATPSPAPVATPTPAAASNTNSGCVSCGGGGGSGYIFRPTPLPNIPGTTSFIPVVATTFPDAGIGPDDDSPISQIIIMLGILLSIVIIVKVRAYAHVSSI